jgi:glycine hydroxymethyltransferase
MHVIAAKAVAFQEALEPGFAAYQRQTLANARAMAEVLLARGYEVMTGGTDNHMLLVDLRAAPISAARAERALHAAHIAVNRASLPGETGSEPTQGDGGLRLGTPAVTTRGLREPEIRALTGWIADVFDSGGAEEAVARVRASVRKMCAAFPVYGAQ